MRRLLETTDRSLIESLLLALESEDIQAHVMEGGGGGLPFVPTIISVRDEDWEAARVILSSLVQTPKLTNPRPETRAALFVLLGVLSIVAIACLCLL